MKRAVAALLLLVSLALAAIAAVRFAPRSAMNAIFPDESTRPAGEPPREPASSFVVILHVRERPGLARSKGILRRIVEGLPEESYLALIRTDGSTLEDAVPLARADSRRGEWAHRRALLEVLEDHETSRLASLPGAIERARAILAPAAGKKTIVLQTDSAPSPDLARELGECPAKGISVIR